MSKLYTFIIVQHLQASMNEVWDFISSPHNLKVITPPAMSFKIKSKEPIEKMYSGQIIYYELKPMAGFAMDWVTEITHVKEKEYFVDEQRFGPYSFWHHQHFIKPSVEGVEMTDIVHYKIPFGIFGDMANTLFVKKKLTEIFEYRFKKLNELFTPYN